MIYEVISGPGKGSLIKKPQEKKTMDRLIEKGLIRVKEEKSRPETKELKHEPETKSRGRKKKNV